MDWFTSWLFAGAPPEVVWGLVPRIVGGLYAIAFASLAPQVLGLAGSRGISPVAQQLAAAREHYPGAARFWRFPTLLWLSSSDRALRALPWIGMLAGLSAVVGFPGSRWALLACWAIYLSLDACCSLMFPWDCLLLEAGALSVFLPEPPSLPAVAASALPLPVVALMWRLLLVRVMWGFAKLKFIGTRKGDSLYLRGFFAWMPMCTPLGFRLHRAPTWFLRASYVFMWCVEVVCPALVFFTGLPRLIGALGLVALMGGIWATGNWGFFNLGYGALCIVLLDAQSSIFDTQLAQLTSPAGVAVHLVMAVWLLGVLLYFPLNSWATQTAIHWPFDDLTYKRPWLGALIGFYRTLAPFRLMHGYGVFPPNSSPPVKVVPVFEGSDDGVSYRAYGYRYMPSTETSGTPIVAPHHPRIDHLCIYAGSGMSDSDYLTGLVGAAKAYGFSTFSPYSWLHRLAQRLLEGEPSVLALLGDNPFPARPPRFVRVKLSALMPETEPAALRAGRRWRVRDAALAFAPRSLDPLPLANWLTPPELFHPDFVHYRRSSPALAAMLAAHERGVPHDEAVCVQSDLQPAEVESFWNELVPLVAQGRGDFSAIDAVARAVDERFGAARRLRYERIAERYAYLLRVRLEPHFYGDAQPRINKRFNFRFHLLLHEIILDGRAAYEATLREPGRAAERTERQSEATELHFAGVMRNEIIRYHGQALRIARRMTNAAEPVLPGILELKDLLTEHVPAGETWLPECTRSDSGEWRVDNFSSS